MNFRSPSVQWCCCARCFLSIGIIGLLHVGQACADEAWLQAISQRNFDAIEQMLEHNAQFVNELNKDGKTALMQAASEGRTELVQTLLKHGANINLTNSRGGSALMYAATGGDAETVSLLLARGAEVNARATNGWTSMTLASAKGYTAVVKLLLEAGADANLADVYGWTPLMRAIDRDRLDVVQVLLANQSVQVNARDDQGETALHHAANKGDTAMVRLLLAHRADASAVDNEGRTPATVASAGGYAELAKLIKTVERGAKR